MVNIKRKRNWLYMDYGTTNSNFLQMDKCRVPYLLVQPHEVPGLSTKRQQNSDGGGPVGQLVQILKPKNFVRLNIKHRKDQNHYAVASVADPDPGSGAFLTHIFESLMTIFCIQSSIVLRKLVQIFFFGNSNTK